MPGMIKWPGKIPVRSSNGMVSIHDFFPTLAKIIGAEVPQDRPIDGIDQSQFFFGTQQDSNREGLLTFIGEEIVGVRWRQYRFYPKSFVSSQGNPSMPAVFYPSFMPGISWTSPSWRNDSSDWHYWDWSEVEPPGHPRRPRFRPLHYPRQNSGN